MYRFAIIALLFVGCSDIEVIKETTKSEKSLKERYDEAWHDAKLYDTELKKIYDLRREVEKKIKDATTAEEDFKLNEELAVLKGREDLYWDNWKKAEETKSEIIKQLPRK